jgi:hypothetical protein
LIAELETRVEHLKASEVDMKNLFYREKEAREVLEYDYKQFAYECDVTPDFRRGTKCISYVLQDQFTHI